MSQKLTLSKPHQRFSTPLTNYAELVFVHFCCHIQHGGMRQRKILDAADVPKKQLTLFQSMPTAARLFVPAGVMANGELNSSHLLSHEEMLHSGDRPRGQAISLREAQCQGGSHSQLRVLKMRSSLQDARRRAIA